MLWPQAALHTGNGSMGDVVFDTLYSSNVPFINNVTYQLSRVKAAGAALDKTGKPLALMGHSQGGIPPHRQSRCETKSQRHSLVLLVPSESATTASTTTAQQSI
ncbi:hypothetical protein MAA_11065 [Metarhizium robertsii ARSEF 23]|uniref:Uncharacterized protein n=1 Tax=Metarhizium robertsii (strain ARSEF 23 / ATCC MYA-3075) TaxID=655844 RepID=A0A0B2XEU0_METRA|nr:uncharacterized protein MAA_11065 [Metarhizium robertsii ARSEF 23]KHO11250.1 hypothetical protein MAA_11065 [Metarhizium robertsii ARSEF 23]